MNNRPIPANEFLTNPALLSAYAAAYKPKQTIQIKPSQPQQPQQPVGKRRAPEEIEQIRIVKERVDAGIKKDHSILMNPDYSPFQSIHQVVERLLPWHCFQIHDYEHESTPAADLQDIYKVLKKQEELQFKDQELQTNVYSNFITKLDQSEI